MDFYKKAWKNFRAFAFKENGMQKSGGKPNTMASRRFFISTSGKNGTFSEGYRFIVYP